MRTVLLVGFVALLVVGGRPALGSDAAEDERLCRQHLEQLGRAIKSYRAVHDGKGPKELSELYYLSYADDVAVYRCPTSGAGRLRRTEIDEHGDYTTEPLPGSTELSGMLVRERSPHHGDGKSVLAAFEDGSIKPLPVTSGATGGEQGRHRPTDGDSGRVEPPRPQTLPSADPQPQTMPADDSQPRIQRIPGDGPDAFPGGLFPPGQDRQRPDRAPGDSREDMPDREKSGGISMRGELDPESMLQFADLLYTQGGYDPALQLYERVLEADPTNQRALMGHGRASIRVGSLRVAQMRFKTVLASDPRQVEARRLSGMLNLVLGDVPAAAILADALHDELPNDPDVAMLHAQVAFYGNDDAEAARRFALAAKLQPQAAKANRELADAFLDERFYKLALLHYVTASCLDPADEEALLNLGASAAKVGQKRWAIRAYSEYLRRQPAGDTADHVREQLGKLTTPG